jgi:aminoglycoside phosphotransferase (APT) family kinase protein
VGMHPDQLSVKVETVQELVAHQFPEWSGLPITGIASQGTVNALFRIGDQLVARFPLQPAAVDETRRWLESEAESAP